MFKRRAQAPHEYTMHKLTRAVTSHIAACSSSIMPVSEARSQKYDDTK